MRAERVAEVVDELQAVLVAALRHVLGLAEVAGRTVDLRHAVDAVAVGVGERVERRAHCTRTSLSARLDSTDVKLADDVLVERVGVGAALAGVEPADAVAGRDAIVGAIARRQRVCCR